MNNFKFDYGKKYHYLLKYIIMSIPVLLLVLSFLFPTKQINNNYSVLTSQETETTIEFNQQVDFKSAYTSPNINTERYNDYTLIFNRIATTSIYTITRFDVISNHEYLVISNIHFGTNLNSNSPFGLYNNGYFATITLNNIDYQFFNASNTTLNINMVGTSDTTTSYNLKFNLFDLTQMGLEDVSINDFLNLFPLVYYSYNNGQGITLSTLVNNVGDNVLTSNEVRSNNTDYLKPLNDFYRLNINSWYDNLLNQMNLDLDNETTYYIYHIPLYIIYLYIFDIILDLFGMIFRMGHKMITKIGGDY